MNKAVKLTLILLVTVAIYILFVHEPAHYISCVAIGGDATFKISGINPAVNCEFNGASNVGMFFMFIAPYLVDLIILLAFLKIKRNKLTYFIPTAAFLNTVANSLIDPLIHVQAGNDFVNIAHYTTSMYWYGSAFVAVNVFLWITFYRADFSKKKIQEILKRWSK